MPRRNNEGKKPSAFRMWLAGGGVRPTAERRKAERQAKDKGKEKERPPKKNVYADFSVPGGRLVRSTRKPERARGQYELKKSNKILGW